MKKLHEIGTTEERRKYIENAKNISCKSIEKAYTEDVNIHCENLIGAVPVPLGVAGPLRVNGNYAKGEYYVPLATTEGALVASVNRGCKAITLSGGASVYAENTGTTRGSVFETNSIEQAQMFKKWLVNNEKKIKNVSESTSKHLTYLRMKVQSAGTYTFVRFSFDTHDAMGMNMVTLAVKKITDYIEKETGISCLSIAGNFDIDKKPAWLNSIEKRGFAIHAEAVITKNHIKNTLKTNAQSLYDVWLAKCMIGSALSGSLGFNAHYANIVAAFYIATGQDPAHIVEGSMGITTVKIVNKADMYVSVYLPAVLVGIVGGGTKLSAQHEAIKIVGAQSSSELAEVLAGSVLAGELSLLASLSEGSLSKVHEALGR